MPSNHVNLEHHNPEQNMHRYYQLTVCPTLFVVLHKCINEEELELSGFSVKKIVEERNRSTCSKAEVTKAEM